MSLKMSLSLIIPFSIAQHGIPNDVLLEIFKFVNAQEGSTGLTTITKVCQSWRTCALDFPFLWTKIDIKLGFLRQEHRLTLSRLQLSKGRPLDLTLYCARHLTFKEKEMLIIPHAHRIRRLTVHSSCGLVSEMLWKDLQLHMPLLEEFRTTSAPDTHGIHVIRKLTFPEDPTILVPYVEAVSSYCMHYLDWNRWKPYGLTSLKLHTNFFAKRPSLLELHPILACTAPTLVYFEFEGCLQYPGEPQFRTLEFPELRSMAVSYFTDICPLLEIIDAPSLKALNFRDTLECPFHPDPLPFTAFEFGNHPITFLQQIGRWTSINHLGLFASQSMPRRETLEYLQSLTNLESLHLYGNGGPQDIANILFSEPPSDAPLLPGLKHLVCTLGNQDPKPNLPAYIATRKAQKLPPLEKLTVNTAYFPYLVDMVGGDKLREFLAEAAVTVKSIDNPIPRCAIPLIERDSGSDILLFAPPYASGPPTPPLSPRTLAAQESYLDTLG